jgi:hypothetical protein
MQSYQLIFMTTNIIRYIVEILVAFISELDTSIFVPFCNAVDETADIEVHLPKAA